MKIIAQIFLVIISMVSAKTPASLGILEVSELGNTANILGGGNANSENSFLASGANLPKLHDGKSHEDEYLKLSRTLFYAYLGAAGGENIGSAIGNMAMELQSSPNGPTKSDVRAEWYISGIIIGSALGVIRSLPPDLEVSEVIQIVAISVSTNAIPLLIFGPIMLPATAILGAGISYAYYKIFLD